MAKNRENHYSSLIHGSSKKNFIGVVKIKKRYYLYSEPMPLREAIEWTQNQIKNIPEYLKAYVQSS